MLWMGSVVVGRPYTVWLFVGLLAFTSAVGRNADNISGKLMKIIF